MTSPPDPRSFCSVNPQTRERLTDIGICVAIAAYSLPAMHDPSVNDPRATLVGPLLLPLLLAPVFIRRGHPLGAAALFFGACVVSGIPTFAQFRLVAAVPVGVLVAYAVATRCRGRRAAAGLALVLGGLLFVGATESVIHGLRGAGSMAAFVVPICLAVWGAGLLVASRVRAANELAARSDQLRRQREATAALAVEIDRERLAADLDTAVRSRLERIVQLSSADAEPGRDQARFSEIESLGRESLDRMRSLLGLLRADQRGARAPRPTLEQLDALLADARSGGRVVDLEVVGDRRSLPVGVELAAYRTVQHALAAIVGVRDDHATVRVQYLPDRLELEVRGRQSPGAAASAALLAARERIVVVGGSFSTETPSPGGRVVRAWLPAPLHA